MYALINVFNEKLSNKIFSNLTQCFQCRQNNAHSHRKMCRSVVHSFVRSLVWSVGRLVARCRHQIHGIYFTVKDCNVYGFMCIKWVNSTGIDERTETNRNTHTAHARNRDSNKYNRERSQRKHNFPLTKWIYIHRGVVYLPFVIGCSFSFPPTVHKRAHSSVAVCFIQFVLVVYLKIRMGNSWKFQLQMNTRTDKIAKQSVFSFIFPMNQMKCCCSDVRKFNWNI